MEPLWCLFKRTLWPQQQLFDFHTFGSHTLVSTSQWRIHSIFTNIPKFSVQGCPSPVSYLVQALNHLKTWCPWPNTRSRSRLELPALDPNSRLSTSVFHYGWLAMLWSFANWDTRCLVLLALLSLSHSIWLRRIYKYTRSAVKTSSKHHHELHLRLNSCKCPSSQQHDESSMQTIW